MKGVKRQKKVKRFKQHSIIRLMLGIEMGWFMYLYVCGSQGIYELMRLRVENKESQEELNCVRVVINDLQQELVRWKHNDFLREKIAREELQMVRKGEEVYYLTSR